MCTANTLKSPLRSDYFAHFTQSFNCSGFSHNFMPYSKLVILHFFLEWLYLVLLGAAKNISLVPVESLVSHKGLNAISEAFPP